MSICQSHAYEAVRILKGEHTTAIIAMSISPTSRFLASADADIVVIWDLPTGTVVHRMSALPLSATGLVTVVCWLCDERLALGTDRGWLVVLAMDRGTSWRTAFAAPVVGASEIVCADARRCADTTAEILIAGRSGHVELWLYELQTDNIDCLLFSRRNRSLLPIAVRLAKWRGIERAIVVGSNTGALYALDKDAGDVHEHFSTGLFLGAADVGRQGKAVVTCDTCCQMHRLPDGELLYSRKITRARTPPIRVAFVENEARFATGSDQGAVLLFDSKTGQEVGRLTHGYNRLVSSVTARDHKGKTCIASALTDLHASGDIVIWERGSGHTQVQPMKAALAFIVVGVGFSLCVMGMHALTARHALTAWRALAWR